MNTSQQEWIKKFKTLISVLNIKKHKHKDFNEKYRSYKKDEKILIKKADLINLYNDLDLVINQSLSAVRTYLEENMENEPHENEAKEELDKAKAEKLNENEKNKELTGEQKDKPINKSKEPTESKETTEPKRPKESKEPKEPKESKQTIETQESQVNKGNQEQQIPTENNTQEDQPLNTFPESVKNNLIFDRYNNHSEDRFWANDYARSKINVRNTRDLSNRSLEIVDTLNSINPITNLNPSIVSLPPERGKLNKDNIKGNNYFVNRILKIDNEDVKKRQTAREQLNTEQRNPKNNLYFNYSLDRQGERSGTSSYKALNTYYNDTTNNRDNNRESNRESNNKPTEGDRYGAQYRTYRTERAERDEIERIGTEPTNFYISKYSKNNTNTNSKFNSTSNLLKTEEDQGVRTQSYNYAYEQDDRGDNLPYFSKQVLSSVPSNDLPYRLKLNSPFKNIRDPGN